MHWNIARCQQVLGLAGLTLGEYLWMLQQPDFVGGRLIALGSEAAHGFQGRQVLHQPQVTHDERCH